MTRRVEEGDAASVGKLHVVGTDVLGDTSRLTSNDVGVADVVKQRGLAVVDVSHDGNDRRTRHEVVLVVLLFADSLLHFRTDIFGLEAELVGNKVDGLSIEPLVDGHHDTYRHEGRDDLCDADIHHRCQFADGYELRQLQHLVFALFGACFLVHLLLDGFALLLTILGTLLVLVLLVGQSCESLLYLTCHVLFAYLQRLLVAVAVLLFLATALAATVAAGIGSALLLIGSSIDVDTSLLDALTLLAFAGSLLLTFLAALFLGFLLWTGALVDGTEVYLAQHVHLGGIQQLVFILGGEDFFYRCRSSNFLALGCRSGLNGSGSLNLRCLNLGSFRLRCLHLRSLSLGLFCLHFGLGLCRLFHLGCFGNRFRLGLSNFSYRFFLLLGRFLTNLVKVYLSNRLELGTVFLYQRLHLHLRSCFLRLLFLRLLLEQACSIGLHVLVALELLHQRVVLLVAELEVQVTLHLTQLLLFQEVDSRLESDVQFAYCFI